MKKIIALYFVCFPVFGHGYYYPQYPTQNTVTLVESVNNGGIALAIAQAQHQFDWGTHSWQGSVGVGGYGSSQAFSFGAAKRFDRTLITGSIGKGGGEYGMGASINWRF